jgi:hypothetical protein
MYSQVDKEGHGHIILENMNDNRSGKKAIAREDAFITMHNGPKRWQNTTARWQLLCQWKDGSTNRVALKDMKESYPVQVADFAKANRIEDETAFA